MSHGGVIHIDAAILAEIPKLGADEGGAQVGDDPVRYSESVGYFFDELSCIGCCGGSHGFDFNPLCKFVYRHKYVIVPSDSCLEGCH